MKGLTGFIGFLEHSLLGKDLKAAAGSLGLSGL